MLHLSLLPTQGLRALVSPESKLLSEYMERRLPESSFIHSDQDEAYQTTVFIVLGGVLCHKNTFPFWHLVTDAFKTKLLTVLYTYILPFVDC